MGNYNEPVKRNDNTSKRCQSKKAYLNKRVNMAKQLFNTHIPTKEIKAIEDQYLERMDEIREDSLIKFKGDFVIHKIEDFNKIEISPPLNRKNTKPNSMLKRRIMSGTHNLANISNSIIIKNNNVKDGYLEIIEDYDDLNNSEAYHKMLQDKAKFLRSRVPASTASGGHQSFKFDANNNLIIENPVVVKKTSNRKYLRFSGLWNKDLSIEEKFNYYHDFRNKILLSNKTKIGIEENVPNYKAYIAKGNNGCLIKDCLKRRWWWNIVEDYEKDGQCCINFIWTQKNKNYILNTQKEGRANKNQHCCLNSKEKHKNKIIEEFQELHIRIVNQNDYEIIKTLQIDKMGSFFCLDQVTEDLTDQTEQLSVEKSSEILIPNHFECYNQLSDKTFLFKNMKSYYEKLDMNVFNFIPLTFVVNSPTNDIAFNEFVDHYKTLELAKIESASSFRNLWIIKPGEDSNRGRGVYVMDNITKIRDLMKLNAFKDNGERRTFIIQKYIECPLLYKARKFDIRVFMLITWVNGRIRGYFYKNGYARTSSKEFDQTNIDNRLIHQTNESVQKKADNWGKFESGNKLTFEEQSNYIDNIQASKDPEDKIKFETHIYPKIRNLTLDTIKATYKKINPSNKKIAFELFGLDFMIDHAFEVWLIEVNTNPCQTTISPVTCKLIPQMIENLLRICIDPQFPPPKKSYKIKKNPPETILEQNKFELFFAVD